MKIAIVFSCIMLFCSVAWSQSLTDVPTSGKAKGKNMMTGKNIMAKEYTFSETIYDSYFDTISGCATLQLRGSGKKNKVLKNLGRVVLFDLNEKQIKWTKELDYRGIEIKPHQNFIYQTVASSKSNSLEIETGNINWEIKNILFYAEPFQMRGIGYKFKNFSGITNTLQGIDLTNGDILWNRELVREYGWNDVLSLNDSTLMVAASGLHAFNLNTGKGWDYYTITGHKDYTGTIAANAAGLALGLLTGAFMVTTGHELVSDIVSNVLMDDASIYFASREKIACLTDDGIVKWTAPMPKDKISKSTLFQEDGILYMINNGFAFMNYRKIDYGEPFIAAYDAESGAQLFFSSIAGKKNQIKGFEIDRDTAFIVFNNKIAKYSLVDGSLILEKAIEPKAHGELDYFVGNQVFIQTDQTYMSLPLSGIHRHCVHTSQDKTLLLDAYFEVMDEINDDQLYLYYLWYNGYKFIGKDEQTLVIDENGYTVAEIAISNETVLVGSTLYNIQDKNLIEIDLEEVIAN